MLQKAKLNVLENLPDIETAGANNKIEEQLPVSGEKRALNKLILIGAPALVVVLVIIGVLWFYLARPDTNITRLKSGTPAAMIEKKEL